MAEPNRLRRAWVKMVAQISAEQRQREPVADTKTYPQNELCLTALVPQPRD